MNTIAKTFTMAALTALVLGIAPAAKADNKGCSNITIKGTFAYKGAGSIVSPPEVAGPLAQVSTLTFDGSGGVTSSSGVISQNGNIIPVTETGTYQVNSDCTGTLSVQIAPIGIPASFYFVIDASGTEMQIICKDSGVVLSGIAVRQYPQGDWRQ
jgi:hypothetical protein